MLGTVAGGQTHDRIDSYFLYFGVRLVGCKPDDGANAGRFRTTVSPRRRMRKIMERMRGIRLARASTSSVRIVVASVPLVTSILYSLREPLEPRRSQATYAAHLASR